MAIFGQCCCCGLKPGNIVLGTLCLVGSIFVLGNSSYSISILSQYNNLATDNKYLEPLISSSIYLVLALLYIPASICLILGAHKSKRKLVLVFLVVDGINIVLTFLKILIILFIFGFNLIIIISCVIIIAFLIFIWLFPFSLYQALRESGSYGGGGGQVHYSGGGGSPTGGQVQYPKQTQSYVPVPMSVAYPSQGQQVPPPYPQKY